MNKSIGSALLAITLFCVAAFALLAMATPHKSPPPGPELSVVHLEHAPQPASPTIHIVQAGHAAVPLAAVISSTLVALAPKIGGGLVAILAASGLALYLFSRATRRHDPRTLITAINISEGFHEEKLNKLADAPIATRYLLVKTGSDAAHVAVVAATADKPLGVCPDAPAAAGDGATVQMLGATDDTTHCVANGAIPIDSAVFSAGNGKVMLKPTAAGTYWKVGHARTASANDLDEIEVETMTPRKLIVVPALTQTSSATIAALPSTAVNPTKADFDRLLAEAGKLQADFYSLSNALSGDCDVTVATS